jgi:2-polyprenyl-3-methyl-5-hydroxy-6-metoxy-1,4-benzoquinol methylase
MTELDKSIIDLYTRKGKSWARLRKKESSLYERAWLDRFLGAIPTGGTILDLGCGCGRPIAQYFVEQGYQVVGVDTSPDLIEMAQASFPLHTWLLSDMRTVQLCRQFNGLLAWDSFFHLSHRDQRAIFSKFAEHTASGGALMFTSGPSHGESIGELEGEPLYHASLDPSEYRRLLDTAGFHVIAHEVEDSECCGRTVWLAQKQ